jgi:hypothetical protein
MDKVDTQIEGFEVLDVVAILYWENDNYLLVGRSRYHTHQVIFCDI